MAKAELPGPLERRRLLRGGSPELAGAGLAYLEAGRWGEALECLAAANNLEGLEQLAQKALAAGDLFYFRQALKPLGRTATEAELNRLAKAAAEAGKAAFAQALTEPSQQSDEKP